MPAKSGRIVRWGRRGSKFTEAFLEGGEQVELSERPSRSYVPTIRPTSLSSLSVAIASSGTCSGLGHAKRLY